MNGRTASLGLAVGLTLTLGLLTACNVLFPHRSEGEQLYRKHCAECHGLDARGDTVGYMGNAYADLTDNLWKHGGDDDSIAQIIHDGIFAEMPEHPELTFQQRMAIVSHLRVLRHEKSAEEDAPK